MAKTLLNCVNEILKRTGSIHSDSGTLTTLISSARQRSIDIAVQVINEGIDELYTTAEFAMPMEQAESTITLVTGTRSYSLATGLVQLRWPFIDKTNGQYITQFPGGFNPLLVVEPQQTQTGLPLLAAINPRDGLLYLDRIPDAGSNGKIYTYQYDKDLVLTLAADTVPFRDLVFRAMVPAWVQLWRRDMQNEFDGALYEIAVGRASRTLKQEQPRTSYFPR